MMNEGRQSANMAGDRETGQHGDWNVTIVPTSATIHRMEHFLK